MPDAPLNALPPEAEIAAAAIFGAIIVGALAILIWGMAQDARRSVHRVGELFGGERIDVVEWAGAEGLVRVGGELWRARAAAPLAPGDRVRIVRSDGLILDIEKA